MKELFNQLGYRIVLEEAALPDGRVKKIPRVYRCDSVHVIAFAEPKKILLLREYRPFYKNYIWMLPSGHVDKENDIEAAAQRELQEETGFAAKSLTHYCSMNHSETLNFANHVFIGKDLVKDPLPQDAEELIEVHTVSIDEAIEKVEASPVVHLASAYALQRYAREHP